MELSVYDERVLGIDVDTAIQRETTPRHRASTMQMLGLTKMPQRASRRKMEQSENVRDRMTTTGQFAIVAALMAGMAFASL